jgi:hypothetical protein
MTGNDEQSIPSRGSRGGILDEAREWLARSRAAKPLPSERIISSLMVHATLTDAEREAVAAVTANYKRLCDEYGPSEEDEEILATLRGLLGRLD